MQDQLGHAERDDEVRHSLPLGAQSQEASAQLAKNLFQSPAENSNVRTLLEHEPESEAAETVN